MSKEEDIKLKYETQLQKAYTENSVVTERLQCIIQERNVIAEERNHLIKERNAFALQAQQEYERAERYAIGSVNLSRSLYTCTP